MSSVRRDIVNGYDIQLALATTDVTATSNGLTIDRQRFHAAKLSVTSATLTSGDWVVTIQESDDDSVWGTATADKVIVVGDDTANSVAFAATDDDTVKQIGYIGFKRYIRVSITATAPGGTNNFIAHAEQVADFY